jgi:hypothetical protein
LLVVPTFSAKLLAVVSPKSKNHGAEIMGPVLMIIFLLTDPVNPDNDELNKEATTENI